MSSFKIQFNKLADTTPDSALIPESIIEGCEEMSALYRYEILIKVRADANISEEKIRGYVGKRALFTVECSTDTNTGVEIQRIAGVVMSIELTTAETSTEDESVVCWYKWTIRPSLARACYSRNRLVYDIKAVGSAGQAYTPYPLTDFFKTIAARWDTEVEVAASGSQSDRSDENANKVVQLIQNDESDYDFLSRVAASRGLAFVWKMPTDPQNSKEKLYIFDALDTSTSAFSGAKTVEMSARADKTRFWGHHFGVQDYGDDGLKMQLYRDTPTQENDSAKDNDSTQNDKPTQDSDPVLYSIYEQGDILTGLPTEQEIALREGSMRMALNNRGKCYGLVELTNSSPNPPSLGDKAYFRESSAKGSGQQYSSGTNYMLTKMRIRVAESLWQAEVEGTLIEKGKDDKDLYHYPLPRPVQVNYHATETADMLVPGETWSTPKARIFMAQVTDTTPYTHDNTTENTCKVREIVSAGNFANEMTVELGSPFADKNSGLLARPRVGNVLVCMDRGDFSLPVAITSLFREENRSPFADLKTMDRHTLQEQEDTPDYTAVTLRNRVQLPPRDYRDKEEMDQKVIDTEPDTKEAATVTRPLSVYELAKGNFPFHQIQMVTRDNGVNPVQHNDDITNTYISSDVIETVAGFLGETDFSTGYIMENFASNAQKVQETPITRPHFEGVNVYSAKDVLLQSADHQIVNAGGEIVITAAQGITLRVGRSSIKITESGIDITSACGKVINPGAFPAYNPEKTQETDHLMGLDSGFLLGGRVHLDGSGVNLKGPYISNMAVNMFSAKTMLGSLFKVTDFSASLLAPKTTIIGGAAVQDAMMGITSNTLLNGIDAINFTGRVNLYKDQLQDGYKVYGLSCSDFIGSIVGGVYKTILTVSGMTSIVERVSDTFSLEGSMVQMDPNSLTLSGSSVYLYNANYNAVNTPTSGYLAITERSAVTGVAQKIGNLFNESWKMAALGGSLGAVVGGGAGVIAAAKVHSGTLLGETDVFTIPFTSEEDKPAVPTPQCRDFKSKSDPTLLGIIGTVGLVVGTSALSLIGAYAGKLVEGLSNFLYLSKKQTRDGITKIEELKRDVTAVSTSQNTAQNSDTQLSSDETTASENRTAVEEQGVAVSQNSTNVSNQSANVENSQTDVQRTANTAVEEDTHGTITDTDGNKTNVAGLQTNV